MGEYTIYDFDHLKEEVSRLRADNANLRVATQGKTFCHSDEAVMRELGEARAALEEAQDRATVWHRTFSTAATLMGIPLDSAENMLVSIRDYVTRADAAEAALRTILDYANGYYPADQLRDIRGVCTRTLLSAQPDEKP